MAAVSVEGDEQKDKKFICAKCDFSSNFQYYGMKPPFLKSILLLEEAYVKKDPFSAGGGIITLGSHCDSCKLSVCCSSTCSIFYTKRFCLDCVQENINEFPSEIQQSAINGESPALEGREEDKNWRGRADLTVNGKSS